MQVIYGISKFKGSLKKNILSIGVFDGMHAGHQRIIRELVLRAGEEKSKSIVLTFYPNPDSQFLIYPVSHRLKLLSEMGVDVCIVVKFKKSLSNLDPEDFISKYILERIQPSEIIVGKNFRFGRKAEGDINLLSSYAERFNFRLNPLSLEKSDSRVINSTSIRELIKRGDLRRIKKLLRRDYSVFGKVIKGKGLGKKLNYPTANIRPFIPCFLPSGVYMARAVQKNTEYRGVCYIGCRPTLGKSIPRQIEIHLFDLEKSLYRRNLEIRFIKKIRNEKKFSDIEELKKNIRRDIQKIKRFFHSSFPPSLET